MPRSIKGSVVVITGASSGIGHAAALAFARRKTRLVLAARREQALIDVLAKCEHMGAQAIAVPTDMTDETAVQNLADRAVESFGRIDTWINNHGVLLFARFEDTPIADYHRVLEVNLMGTVYGARAVLPIFRRQGSGVLINTGSLDSRISQPYMSAYVSAKHAVRGLSISLREELILDKAHDIHVCTVMPATVDTPIFQHAANYTGRKVKAMPPVYSPERVAKTYVRLARRPRDEVIVGKAARALFLQNLLMPRQNEYEVAQLTEHMQISEEQAERPTSGNLYTPMAEGQEARGGWQSPVDPLIRKLGTATLVIAPFILAWRWFTGRRAEE